MIYSKRRSSITQVAQKMFLDLDDRQTDYLTSLKWDDLLIYLEGKYGEEFKENFLERLVDVLTKEMKEDSK